MNEPLTPHQDALGQCFMDVHAGINTALDLLTVIEEEIQADTSRAGSVANALLTVLQRAGWANQRASNSVCPGLLDAANIADWMATDQSNSAGAGSCDQISGSAPAMAQGNPKFAGLTDDQVKMALERIASTLDMACAICRNEAARAGALLRDDGSYLAHAFYSLESMLCSMGALADMASGSGVVGDVPTWLCGPLFHPDERGANAQIGGGASHE